MDKDGQHVIFAAYHGQVILETSWVYRHPSSTKHTDDVVFQPVVINIDV